MDEEEAIRRRDGIAGQVSDDPLDADARRTLADVRLRALAFALGSGQNLRTKTEEADDAVLLAYLLDTLPDHRRVALETALRGDARAFGRLITLRDTFSSETDKRDRQRADDPARKIHRHAPRFVDVRPEGQILQFRQVPQTRLSIDPTFLRSATTLRNLSSKPALAAPAAQRPVRKEVFSRSVRNGKLGNRFHNLSARVRRDRAAIMDRIDQAHSILAEWQNADRHKETEPNASGTPQYDANIVRERLIELLRELETIVTHPDDELGSMFLEAAERKEPDDILAALEDSLMAPAAIDEALYDEYSLRRFVEDQEEAWLDIIELETGPWSLHLAGTAVPNPQMQMTLRKHDEVASSVEPLLTLVRPTEGFETVNLDAHGKGTIALPAGESIMLLQSDEVWEVRLSFGAE